MTERMNINSDAGVRSLVNSEIAFLIASEKEPLKRLFRDAGPCKGKKLRSRIFFAFAGSSSRRAVKAAAALELIHLATLIHDDVLDHSQVRRELPCLYRIYGIPSSILFGDLLLTQGFRLLSETGNPALISIASNACHRAVRGEIMERESVKNYAIKREAYMDIIFGKTGALFSVAAELGAVQNGSTPEVRRTAAAFGNEVGAVYQILDDCRDYTGTHGNKDSLRDLRGGVVTLPLIMLLERCMETEKADIRHVLEAPDPTDADLQKVLGYIDHYGTIEESLRTAKQYLTRATARGKALPAEQSEGCSKILQIMRKVIEKTDTKHRYCRRRFCGHKCIENTASVPQTAAV